MFRSGDTGERQPVVSEAGNVGSAMDTFLQELFARTRELNNPQSLFFMAIQILKFRSITKCLNLLCCHPKTSSAIIFLTLYFFLIFFLVFDTKISGPPPPLNRDNFRKFILKE